MPTDTQPTSRVRAADELKQVALEQFATVGFAASSLQHIADRAGYSKSSVLYHYASKEALGHAAAKARLVEGGGDATLRTTVFDRVRGLDWPARFTGRALANRLSESWHGREAELPTQVAQEQKRYAAADQAGDVATAVVWASEAVDLIRDLPPAAEIVERMVSEAGAALKRGLALCADADD